MEENVEQVKNIHHQLNKELDNHLSEDVTEKIDYINSCVQVESSESTIYTNNKTIRKRKILDSDDLLDKTLVKTLEKINSNIENPTEEGKDEDYLFMKSLIPQLKRLNNYSKALAKVQIQALLLKLELEFPDKDETI